ncbi:hypothetical protein S1OALGB6SA_345 [Olavius algarvensis spirochete endosymbiont]|nr:hypothetical protein S1OALGB6SA_345 [Olavius algarvensis spirochete endosymbiont]
MLNRPECRDSRRNNYLKRAYLIDNRWPAADTLPYPRPIVKLQHSCQTLSLDEPSAAVFP